MTQRILVVTDNLADQVNGVVTTFRNIETPAATDGYSIVYLTPSDFRHRVSAPRYPEVKLALPTGIGSKMLALDADYIHIATEGPVGLAANIWCSRRGFKFNTSYHTKFPEFLHSIHGIPTHLTYHYVRWFHKHSGRVLTTTTTMVDDLRSHGFTGNIVPWTRGVDRTVLKATVTHPVRQADDVLRLLYVGRVSREKNLDELCRLQDRYNVTVVGDGPDRTRLERQYRGVIFAGYCSGTTLANHYAAADVFVFPSLVDTFGIVMIEANSFGTPVAAYPVPGPIDVVESGVNGTLSNNLVEAIEACRHLDRARIEEHSQQWTWQNCWNIFRDNLIPVM